MQSEPQDKTEKAGQLGVDSTVLLAALDSLGFESCDEGGFCEKCKKESDNLYFGNTEYWDCFGGDTWCEQCVVNLHESNERDNAAAMSSSANATSPSTGETEKLLK